MAGRPVHPDLKPIELGTAEPAAERLTREISWLTTELNRSPIAVMAVLTRAKPTMTGTLRDVVLDFGGAVSIRMMALKVLAGWRVLEASSAAVGLLEGTATPPPLSQLAVRVHAALISGPQAQSARLFALRDSTVAKQLARALGLQGQRSVIDHFDLQFRSGSRIGHRMLSAQVLLASPAPRARQSLEHMLVSGEAEIFRFRLLQLLISEKQYWLAILQSLALNDDSAPLRTLAIRALARSEAKRSELAAFMIDRLREARSADEICESLIFLGSGKEIELKRELTMLAAGSMIQQLAFLRSSKTGKAFTKEIERLAGEGAESVRKEAIFKLGRMGRSRKLLSRMVRDDEPLAGAAALALHLQGVRTSHFQLAMEQLLDTQITVSQLSGWTVEGLQGYLQKRWRIQLTLSGEQASSRLTDELRLPPKITIKIGALLSSFVEQHGLRYEVVENGVKVQ